MATATKGLDGQLRENGFAVARGALEPAQLEALRTELLGYFRHSGIRRFGGKSQPNGAVEIPGLAPLFSHPNIVEIYRRALPGGVPVFTSHCDVHYNTTSGWHDDTASGRSDGGYFGKTGLDAPQVYKIAVYLEDHSADRDGLSVLPGSHHGRGDASQPVHLKTQLGDVAVFDVRTLHAGHEASLVSRAVWRLGCRPFGNASQQLYSILRQPAQRTNRLGIFFSFGKDGRHTQVFASRNMQRALELTGGSRFRLADDLRARLEQAGVKLAEDGFAEAMSGWATMPPSQGPLREPQAA